MSAKKFNFSFKVEKGIPIPQKKVKKEFPIPGTLRHQFAQMKPGDSFLLPLSESHYKTPNHAIQNIRIRAYDFGVKTKFKAEGKGIRIWFAGKHKRKARV